MNYEIIVKPSFEREAKRMAKHYTSFKQDFAILVTQLEQNPQVGTDLGGGLRKIRMKISSKGKGKSGGARVISFTVIVSQQEATINLLYIYDKSEQASISKKEIEELLRKNGLK
ncbi:MAG: type II toxin-antitoxin system RelE/ParE family toxin [Butyricimonas faecalis]